MDPVYSRRNMTDGYVAGILNINLGMSRVMGAQVCPEMMTYKTG